MGAYRGYRRHGGTELFVKVAFRDLSAMILLAVGLLIWAWHSVDIIRRYPLMSFYTGMYGFHIHTVICNGSS